MRLLVVEDDGPTLETVAAVCRRDGHDMIAAAASSSAALEAARGGFDAALVSGPLELVASLRGKGPSRSAPIILVISGASSPRIAAALDSGVSDFILRPLDPEELARRLAVAARAASDRGGATALLGEVAHELGNALTTVLGNIELALSEGPDAVVGASRLNLEEARRATERACDLVAQLALSGEGPHDSHTLRETTPLRHGTERILVVEDDHLLREVLVAMLETLGYQPIACDPAHAPLHAHAPGTAAAVTSAEQGVRKLAPNLKLVIVSGQRPGSLPPKTAWLEKPVTIHALSRALEELLGPSLAPHSPI